MTSRPYWADSATLPSFAKIAHDAEAEVVVVGGGITGLTTAYLLARSGRSVVLLERGRCAQVDTGHTSAHLTMVTDARLTALVDRFGRTHAQAAWDAGDVQALGHLTTPDMLQELLLVLGNRVGGPSRTDVITLHATLLDVEELGAAWLASVEFSGLIRESAEQGAVPFRELWMLAAAKDGAPSWRLARQQALL